MSIEQVVEKWHGFVKGAPQEELLELLSEDCVFFSPIVFTPQRGRDITAMYLYAASQTLLQGGFHYTKQVLAGDHAVLEFETTIDGKYVNGVDIITCNGADQIVEFRVMIRPLQAVDLVHAQMKAMLESLAPKG